MAKNSMFSFLLLIEHQCLALKLFSYQWIVGKDYRFS